LAAILDIYRGIGPIYLNHVSYDEHAHHRGPSSKFALWSLKGIDNAIRRIDRAIENARAVGIREYDLYIWSDHGQVNTVPFQELAHEEPEHVFGSLFESCMDKSPAAASLREMVRKRRFQRLRFRRFRRGRYAPARIRFNAERGAHIADMFPRPIRWMYNWLLSPAQKAAAQHERHVSGAERPRITFVSTGPVANLYLNEVKEPMTAEMWLSFCPEFFKAIAAHEGVGFALVRTDADSALIGHGGVWCAIGDDAALLRHAPALAEMVRERASDLIRWANMESAGDVLLFGYRGQGLPSISYSYEWGGHSGPSREETSPFLVVPRDCETSWRELTMPAPHRELRLADLHARLQAAYGAMETRGEKLEHAV
jgi:hypothetical protein